MKYILIRTDNTFEVVEIEYDNFLNEAHRLLDCSNIIIANPGIKNLRFCIDYNAKSTGKETNILATELYNFFDTRNYIEVVGDVLLGEVPLDNKYSKYDFVGIAYFDLALFSDFLDELSLALGFISVKEYLEKNPVESEEEKEEQA